MEIGSLFIFFGFGFFFLLVLHLVGPRISSDPASRRTLRFLGPRNEILWNPAQIKGQNPRKDTSRAMKRHESP